MNDDPVIVREWLTTAANELLAKHEPVVDVRISRNGTTLKATIWFADRPVTLCVKRISNRAHCRPSKLLEIKKQMNAKASRLAACLPKHYGHDGHNQWIAMEFVKGHTLLQHLAKALRRPMHNAEQCERYIAATAAALANFQQFSGSDFGFPDATRTNGSFDHGLKRTLLRPDFDRHFRSISDPLREHTSRFSEEFFDRVGNTVLPVDAQPKNAIISESDRVYLIDLDYSVGPAALGAAYFLSAFDRLGLRYVSTPSHAQISQWKAHFAATFLNLSGKRMAEELAYFYPWALVHVAMAHIKRRRCTASYLGRRYRTAIHEFLEKPFFSAIGPNLIPSENCSPTSPRG